MVKALRALSMLPVILLLLIGLILVVPPLLGIETLIVLGSSMEPDIRSGDLVYIKKSIPEEIRVGDIITFRLQGNVPATHRVVRVEREQRIFFTRGDANGSGDAPVPFDRLIGRVAFSLPHAGRLVAALKDGYGIPVAAGLILLLALRILLPVIRLKRFSPGKENPPPGVSGNAWTPTSGTDIQEE